MPNKNPNKILNISIDRYEKTIGRKQMGNIYQDIKIILTKRHVLFLLFN